MRFFRLWLFFAGVLATVFLGWAALVGLPGLQLAALPPQADLRPYTYDQEHGREVYIREGCLYCHSQQTRAEGYGADQKRLWGRPAVPGDYVYDQPHLLGTSRTGPDLLNIGARQPSREWHVSHLYYPRGVVPKSVMPPFPWLFEETTSPPPGETALPLRPGVWAVPTREGHDLVEYLLGLNRTYPVKP